MFSTTVNPYYTAALSPAIAALLGMGGALAWQHRSNHSVRLVVAATVAVTCGYAIWLLSAHGVGLPSGLPVAVGVLGVAAVAALLIPVRVLEPRRRNRPGRGRPGGGARGRVDIGRDQAVRTVRHAV